MRMRQYRSLLVNEQQREPSIVKKGIGWTQWPRKPSQAVPHKGNETTWNIHCSSSFSLRSALEDARSWSTSFEKVMKSAAGRSCFRQFLRTEFSEENMMFWLACEELKNETNKTVVEEKVRQIYEDFISILSPKEVSQQGCDTKGAGCMLLSPMLWVSRWGQTPA